MPTTTDELLAVLDKFPRMNKNDDVFDASVSNIQILKMPVAQATGIVPYLKSFSFWDMWHKVQVPLYKVHGQALCPPDAPQTVIAEDDKIRIYADPRRNCIYDPNHLSHASG